MSNHKLFIFDSKILSTDLSVFDSYFLDVSIQYFIFPISSNATAIRDFEVYLQQKGVQFTFLNSVQLIEQASQNIRSWYIQFFASIHEQLKIKNQTLREWFSVDSLTSLWWFSLPSERNTFKTDSFNCLVQLHAIIDVAKTYQIHTILVGFKNEKLRKSLFEYANQEKLFFIDLLNQKFDLSKKYLYLSTFILFILKFIKYIYRTYRIKFRFQFLSKRKKTGSLLMQTFYPNINFAQARQGIFKNNFYQSLQDSIESENMQIIWLVMYVQNSGISYQEAMKYASTFIKNGYSFYFLEEFISGWNLIKAFFIMLRNGIKFLLLKKEIQKAHQQFGYSFFAVFEEDWYESFVGFTGFMSLIYYEAFQSAFLYFRPSKCVYLCEMHAWEKAFCAAREKMGLPMTIFGYQHGTVSHMLLNYFSHPQELRRYQHYSFPLPNKVVCNGQIPFQYMIESGWNSDQVYLAEAIRYQYLKTYLQTPIEHKEPVILVPFSISPKEAAPILSIVYDAFHEDTHYEVWLKSHPFLNIQKVFKESFISQSKCRFTVKEGSIENFLKSARIAIVGESGVSFEALALGCDVIIINVADWINMSPLKNIEADFIHRVNSVTELKNTVQKILETPYHFKDRYEQIQSILRTCFCLNIDSNYPSKFMKLVNCPKSPHPRPLSHLERRARGV